MPAKNSKCLAGLIIRNFWGLRHTSYFRNTLIPNVELTFVHNFLFVFQVCCSMTIISDVNKRLPNAWHVFTDLRFSTTYYNKRAREHLLNLSKTWYGCRISDWQRISSHALSLHTFILSKYSLYIFTLVLFCIFCSIYESFIPTE